MKGDGTKCNSIAERWLEDLTYRENLVEHFGRPTTYEDAKCMKAAARRREKTKVEHKIPGPIRNQMFAGIGQARSTDAGFRSDGGKGGGSNTRRLRGTEDNHKAFMAVKGNRDVVKGKGKYDKGKGNDKGKGKEEDKTWKGRSAPYSRWW